MNKTTDRELIWDEAAKISELIVASVDREATPGPALGLGPWDYLSASEYRTIVEAAFAILRVVIQSELRATD